MRTTTYRHCLALLIFTFCSLTATAQMGWNSHWTWMHGDNTSYQAGSYGTMGVPAASNKPPSRFGANEWQDAAGNFWMYGGVTYNSSGGMLAYGDLWKYTPATNEWTWVGGSNVMDLPPVFGTLGVPAAANYPGARGRGVCWADASGNFWFFGGSASGLGAMNDMWRYNPTTNMWTWVKGPNTPNDPGSFGTQGVPAATNLPPARHDAAGWKDANGDFWLLGGDVGNTTFVANDFWRYSPSSNQWAWMGGDMASNQHGVYGTQGVGNISNKPGARFGASSWVDESGNFWLFGGNGFASAGPKGDMNDLWRYEPANGRWAWMKGSNMVGGTGFGAVNVPDQANTPGPLYIAACQADTFGHLWLVSGTVTVTEVWDYDVANDMWLLRKDAGAGVLYGALGVPDPANRPGGRYSSSTWTDEKGRMYMFGGFGASTSLDVGSLNDLWRLECSNPDAPVLTGWPATVCPFDTFTLAVTPDPSVVSYTWLLPAGWVGSSDSASIHIVADGNSGYAQVYSTNSCPVNSGPSGLPIAVYPVTTDTIDATICQGQSYNFYGALLTATGVYADTFSSVNGCDSVIALDLIVHPIDTPALSMSITQGTNPGCIDSLVEFTATYTNAGLSAYCTWLVNGVPVVTGDVYASTALITGDVVQARLTAPDSSSICLSTGTVLSQSVNMTRVHKPASPLISFIGTLLVSNIANVQWYGPSGLIPGATGQTYQPTQDGAYYAEQINPGCYSDPSNTLTIAMLDVAGYDMSQVTIYPNPASEVLMLDWGMKPASVKLEMFHPSGKKVLQDVAVATTFKRVDLSALPAGIYFLLLTDESGKMGTVKVVHR